MKATLKILSDETSFDPSPRIARNEKEAIKLLKEGKVISNLFEFCNVKRVMLLAVRRDGNNLELTSSNLRKDKDIVLAAVLNKGTALKFADKSLLSDEEIANCAVLNNGMAIKYIDKKIINKNIVLNAISSSKGFAVLPYADSESKKDLDICLYAVNVNWREIQFVDEELYSNDYFVECSKLILQNAYNCVSQTEKVDISMLLSNLSNKKQYILKHTAKIS